MRKNSEYPAGIDCLWTAFYNSYMRIPIDPNKEYKPKEIFEHGFILNHVGKPDYRYILELIRAGKLRARNTCSGSKIYYRVLGSDIIIWKNSTYNVQRQPDIFILKKDEKKPFEQPYNPQP